MKVVKIRIYPNLTQQIALAKSFGCARWVWNYSLNLMTQTYRETGKGLSAYTVKKLLPELKKQYEWLKEPYSQCLQSSVLHLSQAFINFFEGRTKYPRFKSKQGRQSIQYPQAVKNMVKNHTLAKAISDVGWGQFCTMLSYKAKAEGKIYGEIDRFFPSSHLCNQTLLPLEKMDLNVRFFQCPHCGKVHDRDINAAINIRNEGLRLLALGTRATADGGNIRPKKGRRKFTLSEAIA